MASLAGTMVADDLAFALLGTVLGIHNVVLIVIDADAGAGDSQGRSIRRPHEGTARERFRTHLGRQRQEIVVLTDSLAGTMVADDLAFALLGTVLGIHNVVLIVIASGANPMPTLSSSTQATHAARATSMATTSRTISRAGTMVADDLAFALLGTVLGIHNVVLIVIDADARGPCQTVCQDNKFSVPPGLETLKDGQFGGLTKEQFLREAAELTVLESLQPRGN
jgi:hypothetical protein